MADSIFDIFGDHVTRKAMKNVSRQPISNIENMGKIISSGPIKPNEAIKKPGEIKKSFLCNTGKAFQSTPLRKVFSPKAINVGAFIYSDDTNTNDEDLRIEELEFTKPSYNYDNHHRDLLDFLPMPEEQTTKNISPPNTPPPITNRYSMELECSYEDEFFTDNFGNYSIPDDELGLPELY